MKHSRGGILAHATKIRRKRKKNKYGGNFSRVSQDKRQSFSCFKVEAIKKVKSFVTVR